MAFETKQADVWDGDKAATAAVAVEHVPVEPPALPLQEEPAKVIVVRVGDQELRFSPSYTDAELAVALEDYNAEAKGETVARVPTGETWGALVERQKGDAATDVAAVDAPVKVDTGEVIAEAEHL